MNQPAGPMKRGPSPQDGASSQLHQDAQLLRSLLGRDPTSPAATGVSNGDTHSSPPSAPALIVLCGLPGAGKSHFARQLVGNLPERLHERLELVVLETDRLRKALVSRPKYTRGEHARVFSVCHLLIEEYLTQGRRVLFDATNLTEKAREPLYRIAARLDCPLLLVGFTVPVDVVKRRLALRAAGRGGSDYSDATWLIHSRMRPFEEPIQRPHLMVDSSCDIAPVLDQVTAWLAAALSAGNSRQPTP